MTAETDSSTDVELRDDAIDYDELVSHNDWLREEHGRMRTALQGMEALVRHGLDLPPAYADIRDEMITTVRARLADLLALPEKRPGCWEAEHVRALEEHLRGIYDELFYDPLDHVGGEE